MLTWILVGLVAGLVAEAVVGGGLNGIGIRRLILTVLLGVAGAVIGGFIASAAGWGEVTGFNIRSLVIASLG
ncbi:MAG: GlsB/YeaQ/YmgE family stress response membrane protein, partial [Tepidiformaceae bacterium]